ncbi:MAG: hypothetical protein J7K57_09150 [Palaeococcus sp.]|uniref:hypothetical protein n=1 Tax=Palaeococcus sp. (in: euryarchaeotes) TaxID=2820298 RepID=UPI0025E40CF1|nr:hypothetical protein [Palaeococcus sp. (in: euryarchaeotes)]MCD6560009.1 hypothetical protein [Palaeococcus sp. (in: euryarchaeotes)]
MENVKVIFYIEGMGNERKALEEALARTAEALKKEQIVRVNRISVEDVIENEEVEELKYSGMIEAEVEGDFEGIVKATMRYAPAVVEVIGPGRLEIESKNLMKILGEVSLFMGELMEKFGGLAAYPPLDEIPLPRVGYNEEEIEAFILDDRNIRYMFIIETFGSEEEKIKETMLKAFFLEGCKINKVALKSEERDGRVYTLLAAELLSPFETLFQLNAKYAPFAISIEEPQIIDITATELQNTLTDLAGFVYELVHRPIKKKLMEKDSFKFSLQG